MLIKSGEKVLVVAPHPDDESIGCGGLISLYHNQVDVLLVTDGYDEQLKNMNIANQRVYEFESAMIKANVNQWFMLHIPEHNIKKYRKQIISFDFSSYRYVFVPNKYENHQDHVEVYRAVKKALLKNKKISLYEYEVWGTFRKPNIYLDIENVMEEKRKMIECHKTQTVKTDYVTLALGLNSYRGISRGMRFAEAFYCKKELNEQKIRHLKKRIKKVIKK